MQLLLGQTMEEVALILARIDAAQQLNPIARHAYPSVVPGDEMRSTQRRRVLRHDAELDFAIAPDVRIGGAAGAVFVQEMFEHLVPVLGGEIDRVQGDAKPVADGLRIGASRFASAGP